MAEPVDSIIIKYQAPNGYKLVHETDYQAFIHWQKQKQHPQFWSLKEFAWHVWHHKGTKAATDFLFAHRDDLDILNGGFIDYEHTHNGWRISSVQMENYLENIQG